MFLYFAAEYTVDTLDSDFSAAILTAILRICICCGMYRVDSYARFQDGDSEKLILVGNDVMMAYFTEMSVMLCANDQVVTGSTLIRPPRLKVLRHQFCMEYKPGFDALPLHDQSWKSQTSFIGHS